MYQVLYRKWRPEKFADVSGQPQVTTTLKNELKNNRINHAYLFTGSRGTGKTTCAKILSKAVNCLDLQDGEPCGKCENCLDFQEGKLLDVVEMDAASNRGIDDIRDLIDEATFSPSKGKYRVYIIDEVHMLTTEAFNALLKTLEEPPAHVVFILATTEVHKLPQTILSRCQRFDFHRIAPKDIAERLQFVAKEENVTITQEAALLIAVIADGAMRDSLSIMDRCIGISKNIDAEVVRSAAGLAQKDYLFSLSSACINKNVQKALSLIDKLHSESKDMARLCAELIDHFRNFMLIKTVKNPRDMFIMNDEEFDEALSQCDYVTLAEIVYFMDVLQRSAERMGKSSSNRTELETALVKLTAPELDGSNEALVARLSKLEKAVNIGGFNQITNNNSFKEENVTEKPVVDSAKAPLNSRVEPKAINDADSSSQKQENGETKESSEYTGPTSLHNKLEAMKEKLKIKEPSTPVEPSMNEGGSPFGENTGFSPAPFSPTPFATEEKEQQPVIQQRQLNLEEIYSNAVPFDRWQEVVESLKEYSKPIAASFMDTEAYISGDYLLIDAKTDIPFALLKNNPEQKNKIRDAVMGMTGKRYKLGPYKPPVKKEVESNPLKDFAQELRDKGIEVTEE